MDFGDGSANATFPLTNIYDISTTHQYPASAAVGTAWTATVTVTDTTQHTSGTANYYLIQEANTRQPRPTSTGQRGDRQRPVVSAPDDVAQLDDGQ